MNLCTDLTVALVCYWTNLFLAQFVLGWDEHCDEGDNPVVNHVILPPWAKSPEHFVQLHRQVLCFPVVKTIKDSRIYMYNEYV